VAELRHTMSSDEYQDWRAFNTWRNAMQDFEAEKARVQRR
jgi:hypothetical protein